MNLGILLDHFSICPYSVSSNTETFLVNLSEYSAWNAYEARTHVTRFLMEHAQHEWYFGNDPIIPQMNPNDMCLKLDCRDAKRFRSYGWINPQNKKSSIMG